MEENPDEPIKQNPLIVPATAYLRHNEEENYFELVFRDVEGKEHCFMLWEAHLLELSKMCARHVTTNAEPTTLQRLRSSKPIKLDSMHVQNKPDGNVALTMLIKVQEGEKTHVLTHEIDLNSEDVNFLIERLELSRRSGSGY